MKVNRMVKTERDVEKQLGMIKTENQNEFHTQVNVSATVGNASFSKSWAKEKQILIDKVVSLKSENQIITQNLNENHTELSTLKKSKQMLEKRLKDKEKEFSLKIGEMQLQLSKSTKTVEINQKNITNLKRENQLLVSQTKQLKSMLAEQRDEKENDAQEDNVFPVEGILNDKLVTTTKRFYLVRWHGYDASYDSWECE